MLFTEPLFFAFFAAVFLLHWALRANRPRKALLLVASLTFYGAWDWRFLALLLGTTLLDYLTGARIAAATSTAARRAWLAVSLAGNLVPLAAFKYLDFFVSSGQGLLHLAGIDVPVRHLGIILPVGISFYTFQSLSYSIDLYRRRLEPVHRWDDFFLFVAFFPQLVAGPIVRARDFLPQLRTRRRLAVVDFRGCLTLFLVGFVKKACIGDQLAAHLVDPVFAWPALYSAPATWAATTGRRRSVRDSQPGEHGRRDQLVPPRLHAPPPASPTAAALPGATARLPRARPAAAARGTAGS